MPTIEELQAQLKAQEDFIQRQRRLYQAADQLNQLMAKKKHQISELLHAVNNLHPLRIMYIVYIEQ